MVPWANHDTCIYLYTHLHMYVSDYIIIIDIFDMMQLKKPTGLQYSCIESLNWEAWDG